MPGSELALQKAQARIGTLLNNKWRIQSVLGSGGMATVFEAVHRNKKRAAIKMLHPELSFNDNIRERFLREGYVANSIDHPGVVRVDDDDVAEDGAAYLVMELLRGESLDDRLDRLGGTLPLDEVIAATDQLLDVLAAAHAAGVVHRDLKPENLFLTTAGQLKVLDFGIARLREVSSRGGTSIGSFMGTPSFMSPEQARGRWDEVDERSDIWAVGATMYMLLTGEAVHDASTINEQLVLAATATAPSIRTKRPDLPDSCVELVDRALARNPAERWQSASVMLAQLRTWFPHAAKTSLRAPAVRLPASASFETPVRISSSPEYTSGPNDPTMVSSRGTGIGVSTSVPMQRRGLRRMVVMAAVGVAGLLAVGFMVFRSAERAPESGSQLGSEPHQAKVNAKPPESLAPASPSAMAAMAVGSAAAKAEDPVASAVTTAIPSSAPTLSRSSRRTATAAKSRTTTAAKTKVNVAATSKPVSTTATASDPFDRHY